MCYLVLLLLGMPTSYWLSCIIIEETLIQQLLLLMVLPFPCSFHNLEGCIHLLCHSSFPQSPVDVSWSNIKQNQEVSWSLSYPKNTQFRRKCNRQTNEYLSKSHSFVGCPSLSVAPNYSTEKSNKRYPKSIHQKDIIPVTNRTLVDDVPNQHVCCKPPRYCLWFFCGWKITFDYEGPS